MKGRDETIDVLKGIAILLVVLGHIAAAPKLTSVIYSFHMPLFIFISGYLAQHSLLFGKKMPKKSLGNVIYTRKQNNYYYLL